MAYANHECDGCGRILPAYELSEVSDRVETGTSRHERRIGNTPNFKHTGTTRRFSNRVKRLCFRCRVTRFFTKVVAVGVGGLLFITFGGGGRQSVSGNVNTPFQIPSEPLKEAQAVIADVVAKTEAVSSERTLTEEASAPAVIQLAPQPDQTSATASAPSDLAAQVLADPRSVDRVNRAIERAAVSGEPERWKVHKLRGYAVPSGAGASGCRMIQDSIDGGEQGTPFQHCPNAVRATLP